MDLNLIIPFLRVYELNSITQAADVLDVTQPAMSASIKRLEQQLGKALFVRHGRRLEPTSDAHAFAEHFKEIEHRLELALDKPREFTVYAPEHIVIQLPVIEGVKLIENPLSEYLVLDHLRHDKIDMAIESRFKQDKEQSFVYEHLQDVELAYVCREDHPWIGDSVTLEEFHDLEHVTLTYSQHEVSGMEKLTGMNLPRKIVKQVTSPSSMLLCVRDSDAICATNGNDPLIEILGLKKVAVPFSIAPIQIDLVYHKKYQDNHHHKQVRAQILKLLGDI
ncbi:LysR family transcriptional regulator [Vibrio sp. D404a]|uniref:LysR family transcriptional regulator n=1 Tax=unclassified Vibrio TaxID=2614977 RepID=UPI002552EB97|nr:MULTISPECIES: LysR family transcriptional regulator [unclassified Vibrio]MDK9736906.1 LysR family transcriptional regulator [Vibrio sp. D404a]MDK9795676.1 LysR family transcriptional regulator [Vibrio sp. D449a]